MTETNGVRAAMASVPAELARFVAHEAGKQGAAARLTRLADTVRGLSDAASEQALVFARLRRRDDALKAEGKAAGLLEAARLLAELVGEL